MDPLIKSTEIKKLYGGKIQEITTFSRGGIITRISYSEPRDPRAEFNEMMSLTPEAF